MTAAGAMAGQLELRLGPAEVAHCSHEWCDREASVYVEDPERALWWPYCRGHKADAAAAAKRNRAG